MDEEKRDKGFKDLAYAIVFQAVHDYREAILYNEPKIARDCERFFKSKGCALLSGLDGEHLAEKLQNETFRFKDMAGNIFDKKQAENDREPTENAFKCPTCNEAVDIFFGYISKRAKSQGYIARCKNCGLEYKRKINGEILHRGFNY